MTAIGANQCELVYEVNMSCFPAAICAIFMTYAGTAIAAPCDNGVDPNGGIIEFSGILHQEREWGPPNFGVNSKTDSQFTAWIVFVGRPIPVQGDVGLAGRVQHFVSEIQLEDVRSLVGKKKFQLLDGKMVVATGELWKATTPGDMTPVVMEVKTLAPTDKTICRILPEN